MYGVLFMKAETGEKIRCGICGEEAEEGYNLVHENEKEFAFLEYMLQDESNWVVNDCCKEKFDEECSKKGFDFKIRAQPPPEIADRHFDIGDVPSELLKEIDPDHEFYVLKTRNGDEIWGHLFDYDDLTFRMHNCYKRNRVKQKWERVGTIGQGAKYWVEIPTDEITSIKKAPYHMKSPDDYGLEPFTDKK